MSVKFGLSLPAGPPKSHLTQWVEDISLVAPQLQGYFSSMWMTDHFFWDDKPTYEAWTAITYVAASYPAWQVGSIVLGQGYRNPALLAKMASTLQQLTGGRFILGIGAGWKEDEYLAYGYDYPSPRIRLEQLEDTLAIITQMWKYPGTATYSGKHYAIKDAYCEPKPDPAIPIIVGGGGNTTMKLAAAYADGWNLNDASHDHYFERAFLLRQHCEALQRDPATIEMSWFGRLAVAHTTEEALALSNGRWTPDNAIVGSTQQVIDQINRFVAGGVRYFMVDVLNIAVPDTLGVVLEEILPNINGFDGGHGTTTDQEVT